MSTHVIVRTTNGDVRGWLADRVHIFKGIPYAAAPFGPHRLRPPQPVEPWSGVRDALALGPRARNRHICPQSRRSYAEWVAFATNGRCGWPKYELSRRATMRFDVSCDVVNDPRSAERALWDVVGEPLQMAAAAAHAGV